MISSYRNFVVAYFVVRINLSTMIRNISRYLESLDADQYRERAYKNIQDQLHQMNMVLHVTQNVLRAHPIHSDRLVNESVYVSTLNKKAMQEMFKTIARITNTSESKRGNLWLYSIAALSVLGSMAILRTVIKL